MFKNFRKFLAVAGLNALKYAIYIVCAPILVVFALYGLYFIVAGFLWVVLIDGAFITAVLIFMVNFFMFFVALFDANLWITMGNMWSWLWNWFAGGNIALWPHFVRSFPLYFASGMLLMALYKLIQRLESKLNTIKNAIATPQ